jgi:hypothetical protein
VAAGDHVGHRDLRRTIDRTAHDTSWCKPRRR